MLESRERGARRRQRASADLESVARRIRTQQANEILEAISALGRRFFRHQSRVSKFTWIEKRVPLLHYVDGYTRTVIFVHWEPRTRGGRWRGFTEGGTLQRLVEALRDYILTGNRRVERYFGPWTPYYCDGDLWGYGDDMKHVRARVMEILSGERGPL